MDHDQDVDVANDADARRHYSHQVGGSHWRQRGVVCILVRMPAAALVAALERGKWVP
jgi:hypothetical protein